MARATTPAGPERGTNLTREKGAIMPEEATGPCVFCETEEEVKSYPWAAATGDRRVAPVNLCPEHWGLVQAHSGNFRLGWCEIHGHGASYKLCPCGRHYSVQ